MTRSMCRCAIFLLQRVSRGRFGWSARRRQLENRWQRRSDQFDRHIAHAGTGQSDPQKLDLAQSALVDPELGITGSADFDGTLTSDGHIAKANGTLKATSLKLVPKGSPAAVPVQVVFAVEHDLKNESGKLTQGDVAIGKALAKLTGTYDMNGETTSDPYKTERPSHAGRRPRSHASRARRGSSHGFETQGGNALGRNRLRSARSTNWSPRAG